MFNLIDSDLYCRKIKTNHFYFIFFRAALLTFEGERFCTVGTLVVWEFNILVCGVLPWSHCGIPLYYRKKNLIRF